jgi:broad specificity phosphatase PhoE
VAVRLLIIARHAESTLNLVQRINGDPTVEVQLTPEGEQEARDLGLQIANVPVDLCVHTRFSRTRRTADLALAGRDVEMRVEQLFDDIDVGDLEGETIEAYRAWKRAHTRADAFPGGESLDDAARRYAKGFRRLMEEPRDTILLLCHEIPLRYALNGSAGSDELDGPVHQLRNATPYLFDEAGVRRAVEGIERLAPSNEKCGREDSNLQASSVRNRPSASISNGSEGQPH